MREVEFQFPVVTVRMAGRSQSSAATAGGGSIHYHRDIRRVSHDVIDRRSLLRLRNQRFDVFAFCIGVDLVVSA
jgi:hypothetical protein